ncbi:MAG: hypothetical protein QF781_01885 [Phycisphaerales bacterium]|jgi:hypothetical protein|nr:hypothetical protein [Phycisphaerales bacterium]MDP7086119.1 hypothetical protein [Phycisphaerales bacterium]MDP7519782.1 hypothetical protein [Phycisphaerales bacterium]HJN80449.1 hypothetical protein [Phycisphaerales bacterium]|tara:strand:+ start:826 stop:1215 length:390 start_codon:yes stop_codon:yes gene_type:complete
MQQSASESILLASVSGDQSRFFGTVSLIMGIAVWATEIFVPVICFGPLGMRFQDVEAAGSDTMSSSQWTAFLMVVALAFAGFLAIVGVVLGLLGASLATSGRRRAVIGICLNVAGWIVVAIFFLASFGG